MEKRKRAFAKIRIEWFFPLFIGVFALNEISNDNIWYAAAFSFVAGLAGSALFYEYVSNKELKLYQSAIDDALIVFEGSAWAKAYYKLRSDDWKLNRELGR